MMADLFWLSDAQWAVMEPFMPRNRPGARRVDDRRTISGIVHVIKSGCRWRDCPPAYGPHTTVYNRFNRWSRRGFWRAMLIALAEAGWVAETRVLGLHRWPIFVTERIMEEVGHGAVLQALRKRGAGQERADARQAALLVQGLRPELHRYPRTRQAAGPEGGCRAALCQWPIDEPHGQAAWRVDAHRPGLAGAVRASVRAEA